MVGAPGGGGGGAGTGGRFAPVHLADQMVIVFRHIDTAVLGKEHAVGQPRFDIAHGIGHDDGAVPPAGPGAVPEIGTDAVEIGDRASRVDDFDAVVAVIGDDQNAVARLGQAQWAG